MHGKAGICLGSSPSKVADTDYQIETSLMVSRLMAYDRRRRNLMTAQSKDKFCRPSNNSQKQNQDSSRS